LYKICSMTLLRIKKIYAPLILLMVLSACVPQKKFQELEAGYKKCQEDNEKYISEIHGLESSLEKEKKNNAELNTRVSELIKDTNRLGNLYRQSRNSYNKLSASYDLMAENKNRLLAENALETKKLIEELEAAQRNLQGKEDTLKTLDKALKIREDKLASLLTQLDAREQRVKELEDMLARKDSAVTAIKRRVQEALMGFEKT